MPLWNSLVVAVQEHKTLKGETLNDRDRTLKTNGWMTCWGPATSTDKSGVSSGVLLACRSPAVAKQVAVQWLGREMNHRLVTAVCKLPGRSPVIVFSIYLRVSEGMTPTNLEIVASAVATADHHLLPCIILGDWNMTAKTIAGSGIVLTPWWLALIIK